jgi:predicted HTH transcriptional regulator
MVRRKPDKLDNKIIVYVARHPACCGWNIFKNGDIGLSDRAIRMRIADLIDRGMLTVEYTRGRKKLYVPEATA